MAFLSKVDFDPFASERVDGGAAGLAALGTPPGTTVAVAPSEPVLTRVEGNPFAGEEGGAVGGPVLRRVEGNPFADEEVTLRRVEGNPFGDESSVGRRVFGDTGVALAKGVVGLPQAVIGAVDVAMTPMREAGRALRSGMERVGLKPADGPDTLMGVAQKLGVDFETTKAWMDTLLTPEQKRRNADVEAATGFLGKVRTALKNPSTLAQMTAESAPSMLGGAGVARGMLRVFPQLPAIVAAAIGEGMVSGGQTAATAEAGGGGKLSAKQAAVSAGSGVATALIGVLGGRVARRLGVDDVDVLLSGGASVGAKRNVLRRALTAAVLEGGVEELPQSMQEQVAANVNAGRPWDVGVWESGAMGALVGTAMGGGGTLARAGVDAVRKALEPPAAKVHDVEDQARQAFGDRAQVSQVEDGRTVRVAHEDGSVQLLRFVDAPARPTDGAGFVRSVAARPGGKESVARAREAAGGNEQGMVDALWQEWAPSGSTRVEPEVVDPETGASVGAGVIVELVAGEATRGTVREEVAHLLAILSGNRVEGGRVVDPATGAALDEEAVGEALAQGEDHPVLNRMRTWALQLVGMFRKDSTEPLFWTAQRALGEWGRQVREGGATALRRSGLTADERADLAERAARAAARFDVRAVDVEAEGADPVVTILGPDGKPMARRGDLGAEARRLDSPRVRAAQLGSEGTVVGPVTRAADGTVTGGASTRAGDGTVPGAAERPVTPAEVVESAGRANAAIEAFNRRNNLPPSARVAPIAMPDERVVWTLAPEELAGLRNRVRDAERALDARGGVDERVGPVTRASEGTVTGTAGDVIPGRVTAGPDRTLVTRQLPGAQVVAAPRVQRALFDGQGRLIEGDLPRSGGSAEDGQNGPQAPLPPPAAMNVPLEGAVNPPPVTPVPGSSPGAGGESGGGRPAAKLNVGVRASPKSIMRMGMGDLRGQARQARYPGSGNTVWSVAGARTKGELQQALLAHRAWYMKEEGRSERAPMSVEARRKMSAAARARMDGAVDSFYANMEDRERAFVSARAAEGRLLGEGVAVELADEGDAAESDWVVDAAMPELSSGGARLRYAIRDRVSGEVRIVGENDVSAMEGGSDESGERSGADPFGEAAGVVSGEGAGVGGGGVESGEWGGTEGEGIGGGEGRGGAGAGPGAVGDGGVGGLLAGTESVRPAVRGETRVAQKPPEALLGELRGSVRAGEAERAQGKLSFQVRRRRGPDGVGADGLRLHGAAARLVSAPGAAGLKIGERPGSWYRPDETSAWVREQEAAASDDGLRTLMGATKGRVEEAGGVDHGAAAGAILANRLYGRRTEALERAAAAKAAGRAAEESAARAEAARAGEEFGRVLDELNVLGVHAGRIVQQFRYLRNGLPAGVVELVRKGLAREGLTLAPAQAERLEVVVGRDHAAAQRMIEAAEAYASAPGVETARARDAAAEAAGTAAREYRKALRVLPRSASGMFVSMMQMGVMDTISIGKNTVGNLLFAPVRAGVDVVASAADWGLAVLSGGKLGRQYLGSAGDLWAAKRAAREAGRSVMEAVRTGEASIRPAGEGRDQRAMRPFEAWRELLSGENIARVARENGDTRPSVRAITERVVEGTFGNYTALMQRLLLATDLPFWVVAREMALSNVGRTRGLSGVELARFVESPPADGVKEAEERAAVAVFQGSGEISDLGQKFANFGKKRPLVGGVFNAGWRAMFLFVQTPSNIAGQALQMFAWPASVPLGVAVAGWGRVHGDVKMYRQGLELASRGVVGFGMMSLAGAAASLGVLFGRPDDERRRLAQEATTGTNRLNVDGLTRAVEELRRSGNREQARAVGAWRDGDKTVTFGAMGFPGLAMSIVANSQDAYARALNSDSRKTREAANYVTALAGKTLKATLDLPLLQGIDSLAKAIRGETTWAQWSANWASTLASAFVPRGGKAITDVQSSWMLETRSNGMMDEFVNKAWKERVWPLGAELPLKRDYFGRRIATVPDGANPWLSRMVDAFQTRKVQAGPVDSWLAGKYTETGDVEWFPPIPVKTREYTWPDKDVARRAGIAQQAVVLEPNEYEQLLRRVGVLRVTALQNLLRAPRFRALPEEAQKRYVGRVYGQTLEIGKRMAVEDRGMAPVATGRYRRVVEAMGE